MGVACIAELTPVILIHAHPHYSHSHDNFNEVSMLALALREDFWLAAAALSAMKFAC